MLCEFFNVGSIIDMICCHYITPEAAAPSFAECQRFFTFSILHMIIMTFVIQKFEVLHYYFYSLYSRFFPFDSHTTSFTEVPFALKQFRKSQLVIMKYNSTNARRTYVGLQKNLPSLITKLGFFPSPRKHAPYFR